MNFVTTQKSHLILTRTMSQVIIHKGMKYLSELRIDKVHQTQDADKDLVKIIATQKAGKEAKGRRQVI